MLIQFVDFNLADIVISKNYQAEWNEIEMVLGNMPLHIKASSQKGIHGNPIFDPVGTNEYIKTELVNLGWKANVPIPKEYNFFGQDIDCAKKGVIVEFQFSHYSFLQNNTLRSELFFQAETIFSNSITKLAIIITKASMFPASNSTLYYEQAVKQLTALTEYKVFDVPIRLVGLFESINTTISSVWTEYQGQRSRTIKNQKSCQCQIIASESPRNKPTFNLM
ncbi:MAG: restriction endonuclease [Cyanobacteriota bacterium]|nr:restriction endonuclease [Cyanobacteriota bacterium]